MEGFVFYRYNINKPDVIVIGCNEPDVREQYIIQVNFFVPDVEKTMTRFRTILDSKETRIMPNIYSVKSENIDKVMRDIVFKQLAEPEPKTVIIIPRKRAKKAPKEEGDKALISRTAIHQMRVDTLRSYISNITNADQRINATLGSLARPQLQNYLRRLLNY